MLHELHSIPHAHEAVHPDALLRRAVHAVVPYVLHERHLVRTVASTVRLSHLSISLAVPLSPVGVAISLGNVSSRGVKLVRSLSSVGVVLARRESRTVVRVPSHFRKVGYVTPVAGRFVWELILVVWVRYGRITATPA